MNQLLNSDSAKKLWTQSKSDSVLKWSGVILASYVPYTFGKKLNNKAWKYIQKQRVDGNPVFFDPWRKTLTDPAWEDKNIELKEGSGKEIKQALKAWQKEQKEKERQEAKDKEIAEQEKLEAEKAKKEESKSDGDESKEETKNEQEGDEEKEEKTEAEKAEEKNKEKRIKMAKKAKRDKEEKEKAYKQSWSVVFPRFMGMVTPDGLGPRSLADSALVQYALGTLASFGGALLATRATQCQLEYVRSVTRPNQTATMLLWGGATLLGAKAVNCWFESVTDSIMERGFKKFETKLKSKTFEALTKQEIAYFDKNSHDDLMKLLNQDTDEVLRFFSYSVPRLVNTFTGIFSQALLNFKFSPRLLIFTMASSLGFMEMNTLVSKGYSWVYSDDDDDEGEAEGKPKDKSFEVLKYFKTVRACAREDQEVKEYQDFLSLRNKIQFKLKSFIKLVYDPMWWFLWETNQTFALYYTASAAQAGDFDVIDLSAVCRANMSIFHNTNWLMWQFKSFDKWVVPGARVMELLDREPKISRTKGIDAGAVRGDIELRDVKFAYAEAEEEGDERPDVIKGMNLKIKAGEFVGLVGPSGGGKSTVMALLQRFYDPSEGAILLDGKPLTSYSPAFVARTVGVVSQEPVVFDATIEANIRYGNSDAPFADVVNAAKMANLHDDIRKKVDEYQTQASVLSGGQKQRLTIARALLKNPQILLLDEATSALDTKSERAVQEALATLMQGRTVIAVAHRLSTIMQANKIAVIDGGVVKECGSHTELMKVEGGQYRDLVTQQASVDADARNVEVVRSQPLQMKLAIGRVAAAAAAAPGDAVLAQALADVRACAAELRAEKGRLALLERTFAREKADLMAGYGAGARGPRVAHDRSAAELRRLLKSKMTGVRALQRIVRLGAGAARAQGKGDGGGSPLPAAAAAGKEEGGAPPSNPSLSSVEMSSIRD